MQIEKQLRLSTLADQWDDLGSFVDPLHRNVNLSTIDTQSDNTSIKILTKEYDNPEDLITAGNSAKFKLQEFGVPINMAQRALMHECEHGLSSVLQGGRARLDYQFEVTAHEVRCDCRCISRFDELDPLKLSIFALIPSEHSRRDLMIAAENVAVLSQTSPQVVYDYLKQNSTNPTKVRRSLENINTPITAIGLLQPLP